MDPRTFAVERLGVGDWPRTDGVCFALDVTPDRSAACIGTAGQRTDKRRHVEIVDHRRGTGWAAGRALELVTRHEASALVLDGGSPAASLLPALTELGFEVLHGPPPEDHRRKGPLCIVVNSKEHAQACGMFFDAAEQDALRHLGTDELATAAVGAVTRPLGDAWAWSRKSSALDISPLVTCTLALWGLESLPAPKKRSKIPVSL
jgi:hypothetical protein